MIYKSREEMKKIGVIIGAVLILCFITILFLHNGLNESLHYQQANTGANERAKNAKRIMIKKGDTLWEIASVYYSEEYKDMYEFIEEIKTCNSITSDVIYEGKYLIIPYYESMETAYKTAYNNEK